MYIHRIVPIPLLLLGCRNESSADLVALQSSIDDLVVQVETLQAQKNQQQETINAQQAALEEQEGTMLTNQLSTDS